MTCPADPMAANPDKQTTVGLHYVTGRFVNFSHSKNLFRWTDKLTRTNPKPRLASSDTQVLSRTTCQIKLQNVTN